MNAGRGRQLVNMILSDGGGDEILRLSPEQIQHTSTSTELESSTWLDTRVIEEQNVSIKSVDDVVVNYTKEIVMEEAYDRDVLSPSLLASIQPFQNENNGINEQYNALDCLFSPDDDDDFIPNTSEDSSSDSMYVRRRHNFRPPIIIENSDTESETDINSREKLKTRKRLNRPDTWKCNIRRKKTIAGKQHTTHKGNIIPAKSMKKSCTCKKKCGEKIDNEQRELIFDNYWNEGKTWDMKRQFILGRVAQKTIERRRIRSEEPTKQRNVTLEYKFCVDKKEVIVCKTFFLGTLGISETVVRNAIKKSNYGIIEEDRRGKKEPPNKTKAEIIERMRNHIQTFPKYESHYSREKTGREYLGAHLDLKVMYKLYVEECTKNNMDSKMIGKVWTYRKIFNTHFNLGFKPPETDTCDDCDRYVIQIRGSQGVEKETLQLKYDEHLKEAKTRYDLKAFDKLKCATQDGFKLITVDLQKCLPTPLLTNSLSFYLRKLWTFNYTILDSTTNKSTCVMWDESISGRGGNELSSGLIKWFEVNVLNTPTKDVTIWSDNCAGQNKNIHVIMCYLWLLKNMPNLLTINHKYLMKGHTHMEVDGVHSIIERKKKRQPQFSIMVPWDWRQFIQSCSSDKAPIEVLDMTTEDFKNLLVLQDGPTAPFVHRKKGEMGQSVSYSEIVWMKFMKEDYGVMYYKTSFGQNDFEKVSLIRNRRRSVEGLTLPILQPIRVQNKSISTKKFQDLQKALQWIPPIFHNFYKTLIHDGEARDLPESE